MKLYTLANSIEIDSKYLISMEDAVITNIRSDKSLVDLRHLRLLDKYTPLHRFTSIDI